MSPQTATALASLRRLRQPPAAPPERCELCSAVLPTEHSHLVETASRRLVCACEACAILFDGHANLKYRRVPRDAESWPDFRLGDLQWQALGLPVNLAFFLRNKDGRVVAVYPSPGGVTEAEVAADAWQMLAEENPILAELQPDVEALLVNRVGEARDHFRVGVDECYRLVGLVRTHWTGFSGGDAVWAEIDRFFARLRQQSRTRGPAHA